MPSGPAYDAVVVDAFTRITGTLRESIAEALRQRVIGPDAEAKALALFESTGTPMFDEERAIRTVHSDASMFLGGMRALLLQSLHPLAMAGVAAHSDYKNDPWGRLQRTADFVASTTFGDREQALGAIGRVRRVHAHVTGTARDGRAYSANDPHLLRWVHVAEVDSFLAAHTVYGAERLDQSRRDEYVADMAVIATELGVPAPPTTEQALRDDLRAFRPELRSTPEAREAARYLLLSPPLPLAGRVPYGLIAAAAIAILPVWTRPMLRLPWLPLTERFALKPVGSAVAGTIRWATAGDVVARG